MTTVFEGAPKFGGISGDHARVTAIEDRVLIRAIDEMAEEAVTKRNDGLEKRVFPSFESWNTSDRFDKRPVLFSLFFLSINPILLFCFFLLY